METVTTQNEVKKKTELILSNVHKLPALPKVMKEVLEYLDQDDANASELGKIIIKDQSLSLKILTIANSPLYGLQRKVSTIDFAVLILGMVEIQNIVSTLSVMEAFKNKTDKYLNQFHFWKHSFLVGSIAKRVCEDLLGSNSGVAFTAGFLHDIGVSIIHKYFHSSFVKIYESIDDLQKPVYDYETDILGMNHTEIGNYLLNKWNFPDILCDVVLNHHAPSNSKNNAATAACVHFADYVTNKLQLGSYHWDKDISLSEEAVQLLGFGNIEKTDEYIESHKDTFFEQIESSKFLS